MSGRLYRELDVKSRLEHGMTDEDAFSLLASDGMLVKRPLLICEILFWLIFVGFKEPEWQRIIK